MLSNSFKSLIEIYNVLVSIRCQNEYKVNQFKIVYVISIDGENEVIFSLCVYFPICLYTYNSV